MNLVGGHRHVVTLKSTHEDGDAVHLVMELCAGGELFDSIVAAGSFSEAKAAAIFRRMVEVVSHCHQLGVMHRDLKPENFLLTEKGAAAELKLTDFGLSVFFKHGERFRDLVGSPYYVAPEVLRKNYASSADMWSLGVILYILLSGLPPFWGDTEDQIFKMVLRGAIDFTSEPWPRISDAAKDCVRRLLTVDPAARATAAEILQVGWFSSCFRCLFSAHDCVLCTITTTRKQHLTEKQPPPLQKNRPNQSKTKARLARQGGRRAGHDARQRRADAHEGVRADEQAQEDGADGRRPEPIARRPEGCVRVFVCCVLCAVCSARLLCQKRHQKALPIHK